ncbi:CHAD domain-containing protein [Roseospira navarrensis]|uniref:CHAD domain-containing protein n=1 Tax=Roseospira navarrensis TaxID=140058 RepID=A0A7X1ZHE0_9PROT|nr:CHAD domain-containing protein [Roseospira navarrensis]MQX37532.1 CHAD domain-containing protein [Roseospira navarrensis]
MSHVVETDQPPPRAAGVGADPQQAEPAAPVKGQVPDLRPAMTVAGGFQAIARACLAQMVANAGAVLDGRDPEGVHQMRVGTRRLRSAMALFKTVIAGPDLDGIRADLRWLMGALGPARDADVFEAEIVGPVRAGLPGSADLDALARVVAARRREANRVARAAVADPRFAVLAARIETWIEAGDWLTAPDRPVRDESIAPFARQRLERRWRPVAKGTGRFRRLSPRDRHRLRIQIKKLRYATEFLGSLFPGKALARVHKDLARAQDDLGALNDVAVARGVLREIAGVQDAKPMAGPSDGAAQASADLAWAAGLVAGWHERDARDRLESARRTLKDLARREPAW